jgi:hypothetical protein
MITKTTHIPPSHIGSMWIAFVLSFIFREKGFIKNIGLGKTVGATFVIKKIMGHYNLIKKAPRPLIVGTSPIR